MNLLSPELFQSYTGQRPDAKYRQQLWRKADEQGWPTHKNEDWKYTRLKEVMQAEWTSPSSNPPKALSGELTTAVLPHVDAFLVLHNGFLMTEQSRIPEGSGISIRSEHLSAASAPSTPSFFANLAWAMSPQRLTIEVEPGKDRQIIEVLHLGESGNLAPLNLFGRVGRGSQLTVFERMPSQTASNATLFNHSIHWQVDEGAQLFLHQDFQAPVDSRFVQSITIDQKRDTTTEFFSFSAGGELARTDVEMNLLEPGASARLLGLSSVRGTQQADHCTSIHHHAPHCTSEQLCKTLLSERGQGTFNGLVHVHREAQQTNAAQLNKNLLLSEKAQANTRPRLLVDADDVKAAHGATVGRLNAEEVFYLQSRGMKREQAMAMLARGFAKEVVYSLGQEETKVALLASVETALIDLPISALKASKDSQ